MNNNVMEYLNGIKEFTNMVPGQQPLTQGQQDRGAGYWSICPNQHHWGEMEMVEIFKLRGINIQQYVVH